MSFPSHIELKNREFSTTTTTSTTIFSLSVYLLQGACAENVFYFSCSMNAPQVYVEVLLVIAIERKQQEMQDMAHQHTQGAGQNIHIVYGNMCLST